jgi:quinoprotein glucose dehydrogenase
MISFRLLAAASCSLLGTLTVARAVDAEGVHEDRTTVHSLKPAERSASTAPVDSPGAAEKGFRRAKIPAGFKASLWASEPLLANPVAFSFDGKGRMYVAETHRYRTSVLDIRHYMFMLEDDLANRNQADWEQSIKRNFPNDWQKLGVESEVVRLVEDSDGDGKAESSSVYADGFNSILDGIASGVLARPEGLWLTNIPGLYKLTGTGPDGRAAKKEEVFRGFGVRFNYTGHDLHGLIKGPDGRIYFSIGDRGTSVKTKEGGTIDVPDEGAIFRCEEDGSQLELVMRGLRNPQELAFDDYGNLFTCDNDSDQGDRERLVYVLEGGDAGWRVGYQHCPQPSSRNPWLAEHMWEPRDSTKNQPAYILSPLANLPDGPSGLVHYPGTGLPDEYEGSFFLACYKGSSLTSQVAVFKTAPDGASFKLDKLESFIPGCQATDVDFGPDSRLYVSFWDEGWERTAQGRIMKLEHEEARKAQAAQIAEVQKLLGEGMKGRNAKELVKLLGHRDQRMRLEAQWELAGRTFPANDRKGVKEAGGALLNAVRESTDPLTRLHAIWGVGQMMSAITRAKLKADPAFLQEAPPDPPILSLINDHDETLRAAWIQIFGQQPAPFGKTLTELFVGKLLDPSPRVRLLAAEGLGRCGAAAVTPLIELARREQDKSQEMRHVIAYALFQLASRKQEAWDTLCKAATDSNAGVRLVALIAVARLAEKAASTQDSPPWFKDAAGILGRFLADGDPRIVRETAWLISDKGLETFLPGTGIAAIQDTGKPPVVTPRAINMLGTYGKDAPDEMTRLRALNAYFRSGGQANADMLISAISTPETRPSPALCVEALAMLAQWDKPAARDRVTGLYRPIKTARTHAEAVGSLGIVPLDLLESDPSVTLQAIDTIGTLQGGNWGDYLSTLSLSAKTDATVRSRALHVLSGLQSPLLPDTLKKAVEDPNSKVRIAAAGLLGKSDPALAVKGLAAAMGAGSPQDQQVAFTELTALHSPEADALVAEQFAKLSAGKVPGAAKLELLEAATKREAPAVKEAVAKYEASLPKDDMVARFSACLEGGDAANGQRLFKEHPVAACQRCHMVDKAGGEAGPPLDGIATRKDRRYMLESILLPNAQIAETFRMIVCSMKDGSVKSGVLKSESPDSVTIQLPGDAPEILKTADIASRDNVPSGMLPNMGDLLTKRELRDIVEYLATLK